MVHPDYISCSDPHTSYSYFQTCWSCLSSDRTEECLSYHQEVIFKVQILTMPQQSLARSHTGSILNFLAFLSEWEGHTLSSVNQGQSDMSLTV